MSSGTITLITIAVVIVLGIAIWVKLRLAHQEMRLIILFLHQQGPSQPMTIAIALDIELGDVKIHAQTLLDERMIEITKVDAYANPTFALTERGRDAAVFG